MQCVVNLLYKDNLGQQDVFVIGYDDYFKKNFFHSPDQPGHANKSHGESKNAENFEVYELEYLYQQKMVNRISFDMINDCRLYINCTCTKQEDSINPEKENASDEKNRWSFVTNKLKENATINFSQVKSNVEEEQQRKNDFVLIGKSDLELYEMKFLKLSKTKNTQN